MSDINWDEFTKEGGQTDIDRMWPDASTLKEGDGVQGRYVSKMENIGKNNSNIYLLEASDGKTIGVWGSSVIDNKMRNIAEGKMVAIEFIGDAVSEKTGRTYRDYEVGQGILTPGDED